MVGRRILPAPPKTDVDGDVRKTTTDAVARNVQPRLDAGVKLATDCDSGTGDDDKDVGAFVVTSDAPPPRRDLHSRRSDAGERDGAAKTNWTAEIRSLAQSKLQIRRRQSNSKDEESTPQLNDSARTRTINETKTTTLTLSGAKVTRNVIVSSSKPFPTTTDGFVPISRGVTTKPNATKSNSSQPTADVSRSKTKGPASGGPNVGGSRSARTTPQQSTSPTKDLRPTRIRSKSNARDEYERTTVTAAAGARTARAGVSDVTRRNVVNADTTRRYRTRDDVTTDVKATTARQPGGRSTTTRQNAPAPAPASAKLRSTSQKRPSEIGGAGRQQPARTTHDVNRSQYARSPERGRTSTRQSEFVSRMTDARTSRNIYRSSSASVLSTPQRAASRSPQRQYVPASGPEQERLLQAREAFKKRMSYDASKSAAMGRTAAAVGHKTGAGSTERLSSSGSDSRRSSHGSVSELSDEAFGRTATAVAKYSSSLASDINALSQRVGSGRTLSTVDDGDEDVPPNMVRCFCCSFPSSPFMFLCSRPAGEAYLGVGLVVVVVVVVVVYLHDMTCLSPTNF